MNGADAMNSESQGDSAFQHLLLFDGVCGLCHRWVRFVLARDKERLVGFAALQSDVAAEALARHGEEPSLDSLAFIVDLGRDGERLIRGARGVLQLLGILGFPWSIARGFGVLPNFLLNPAYAAVARIRYRLFGRYDSCQLPSPEERDRFLDA